MVVRGPGIKAGSTFDWIGSNVDVAPTFLSLAGLDPASTSPPMDGKSFTHKLIDPTAELVPISPLSKPFVCVRIESNLDSTRVLSVSPEQVPEATAASVRRELSAMEGVAWRDHHWVEYNSLGSVTRTGHLVDDPKSNTYRALRFVGSVAHGNTLYAEFTALENWDYLNTTDLFIEMCARQP